MLARIFPDAALDKHRSEFEKLLVSVNANFPGLLEGMRLTRAREKRELRSRGLPESTIGAVSIGDARFEEAVHLFGAKLMMALFYRHTGSILPLVGGMPFRWFTNAQDLDEMLPRDVLSPLLGQFAELKRENTSLRDQFFYRFAVADNRRAAAFLAFFNQAIVMLGFVFSDITTVTIPANAKVLRAYSPLL